MNAKGLSEMLLRAARLNPPSDTVPYAFEKRMMTLLASPSRDLGASLGIAWLWRASLAGLLIMFCCGVWTLSVSKGPVSLALELEQVAYAACCEIGGDAW
ncbi:MAG TPA: hypothetical protein P5055_03665 [Candidatus Paceibacterota bacterium]|nr:hypothetical protein [Candidatus Paceibacterota bacterium]